MPDTVRSRRAYALKGVDPCLACLIVCHIVTTVGLVDGNFSLMVVIKMSTISKVFDQIRLPDLFAHVVPMLG